MSEEIAAPSATCANCGAALHGRFCAACGQEAKPLDPPVRHFVKEFAQEFFDIDGRVPRSLRRLVCSPGFLTREYVEGRRVPWLSPLKLYLLASVAMFTLQAVAGRGGNIKLSQAEDTVKVTAELHRLGYANLEELRNTIETARLTWMPRVMFVLVPIFGGLVALAERRVRRRYPSHLVFALHVHAAAFMARALVAAVSMLGVVLVTEVVDKAAGVYIIGYAFLAFRTAYGDSRLRSAVVTGVTGAVYLLILVLATMVVVATAMFGKPWLATWGF